MVKEKVRKTSAKVIDLDYYSDELLETKGQRFERTTKYTLWDGLKCFVDRRNLSGLERLSTFDIIRMIPSMSSRTLEPIYQFLQEYSPALVDVIHNAM